MKTKAILGSIAGLTATLFATSALCQQLEEVVVTAQKREQSLQDVPISVQVIGADQMRSSQIKGVNNLEMLSPSLTFARHYHPGANAMTVRGIGTQVSADAGYIQQSVIVAVDGIPASRAASFWSALPDISRVEILRGPQGTLFGKNATAGVINITTKAPSDQFGAMGDFSIADDTGVSLSATVTGGIPDRLKTRLTVWHDRNQGWGENYGSAPHDIGWLRDAGVRGKAEFEVTPRLTVLLTGVYSWEHANGQWFLQQSNKSGTVGNRQDQALLPVVAGPRNDEVNINSDPFSNINSWNTSIQVRYDLTDSIELISLSSYSSHDLKYRTDVDQVNLPYEQASLNFVQLISWPDSRTYQMGHEGTQELRLHGHTDRVDWTVGGFYSRFQEIYDQNQRQMFGNPATALDTHRYRHVNYHNTSYAFFADAEFKVTEQLTAIGGARKTFEKFDYDYFRDNSTFNAAGQMVRAVYVGPFAGTPKDSGWSARAGLRYEAAPDLSFYGTWSLGYKGPALDLSDQFSNPTKVLVKHETAKSFELGVKSELMDRRLRLNADIFQTTIDNFQAFKIIPPIGTQLVSAGQVRSKGVEVDADFIVAEGLGVSVNAVYDPGKYRNTIFDCYPGQTAALGCAIDQDGNGVNESQNLSGRRLALLPKWKVNIGGRYDVAVPGQDFTFYFRPNYSWQSAVEFSINQDPRTIRKSIGILDLAAGIRDEEAGWDVQVFAKNATDEFYRARMQFVQTIGGAYQSLTREYQGYVGIRVALRTGGEK